MDPEAFIQFAGALPEPLLLVNGDGRIIRANAAAAKMACVDGQALNGRLLTDIAADAPERLRHYLSVCSRTRQMTLGAMTLRRQDGEVIPCRCEGAMLQPASSRDGVMLLFRLYRRETAATQFILLKQKIEQLSHEIHERRRAEEALRRAQEELEQRVAERTEALSRANEELRRSNRALQEFAYVASHDLQEPLRKIMTFGSLLEEAAEQLLNKDGRSFLQRMIEAAHRMQGLIQDLLTFSRVASRDLPLAPVDLRAVVDEVLTDLEAQIKETRGRVEIGRLPVIDADALQMRQLLQNLISNALKFHRKGVSPCVKIYSEPLEKVMKEKGAAAASGCQLVVQDNGIGFEEKYLDRIFAPFQRLHSRSEYKGTGIGLAICQRIAERHGGEITARSRPGQGTAFVVKLPARQTRSLEMPVQGRTAGTWAQT